MSVTKKCKFDISQLTSFCNKIETAKEKTLTGAAIDVKLDELEKRWAKLEESFEQYILSKEADEDVKDELATKYDAVVDRYESAKIKLLDLLKKEGNLKEENKPKESDKISTQNSMPALKLPPCDIPVFEGGYAKWPSFRDMFQAVIGKHPHLAPAQKLYHLLSMTRGAILNRIAIRFGR